MGWRPGGTDRAAIVASGSRTGALFAMTVQHNENASNLVLLPPRSLLKRGMNDDLQISAAAAEPDAPCAQCGKISELCVCTGIEPFDNKVFLLILQHPQEQDRDLGTARLTLRHFRNGKLRIGLSWPNLAKALGAPADPRRWGVLYLGPKPAAAAEAEAQKPDWQPGQKPPGQKPPGQKQAIQKLGKDEALRLFDRHNQPLDAAQAGLILGDLEGIVILDGSWAQAKTLWWRNSWLLKCWRIVLVPTAPSRYGKLRKEPRRDSLSTLEAAALAMTRLEGKTDIGPRLIASFDALLQKYRALRARPGTPEPV
jgi:DTW domain-containing protein YfiP